MDTKLAYQLARVSGAAYLNDMPLLETVLGNMGFINPVMFSQDECQALYCQSEAYDVLAFRGTEFSAGVKKDVYANLYQSLAKHMMKGLCPFGYYEYAVSLLSCVRPLIKERDFLRPLYMTGHSLGGVLATITASIYTPASVYTFGAPRPGDNDFWNILQCPVYRIVECSDPAPFWPWMSGIMQGGECWELNAGTIKQLDWRFRPHVALLPFTVRSHWIENYVDQLALVNGAKMEIR